MLYKSQGVSVKMYGFNSKVVSKNYEQCITNEGVGYSQRGGGGGVREGLMKTFHRHTM